MPIPFKLDYVIEQTRDVRTARDQSAPEAANAASLSPSEAHAQSEWEWARVLRHKRFMVQALREQHILEAAAGINLSPAEAHAHWPLVLEHKWFISERLGRDVGLRVAAIDYFENVRLTRDGRGKKSSVRQWLRRVAQPLVASA